MRSGEPSAVISPSPSAGSEGNTLSTPPEGLTLAFNSPQGTQRTRLIESSPSVQKPWPKDLLSLTHVTIGSLFTRWYTDELYNCAYKTAKERQTFNMCGKTIEFCKLFLPGGSVISKKPSEASALIEWRQRLTHWGQLLDDKVHKFATESRDNSVATAGKRKRGCLPVVAASYKRLTKLDTDFSAVGGVRGRVAVQVPEVIDEASPLVVYF